MEVEIMDRCGKIEVKINKSRIIRTILLTLKSEYGGNEDKIYEIFYTIFNDEIGDKKDEEKFEYIITESYEKELEKLERKLILLKEKLIENGTVLIPDIKWNI